MDIKKTAVGYIRCSSPGQVKGTSLERQYEGCKIWCRDNDVELMKVVVDVGSGYEGFHLKERKSLKAGNLGRWLKSLDNGWDIPDYFIFELDDRLTRCAESYFKIRDRLKAMDIVMKGTGVYDEIYFLTAEEKKAIYK